MYLSYYGVDTKLGYVELNGFPIIHKHKNGRIVIGKGTTLVSKSKCNSAGINHPMILASLREDSELTIQGNFGASGSAIVAMNSIIIENGVGIGANSHVYDTDFHPFGWHKNTEIETSPIVIGKNAWIAANSIILKGVEIGENSVIGAGSVVTKNTQPNAIYRGIPAKLIKKIP